MVTRDAWRALAEKTLKGATVDSLSRTIEGVQVQPLYDAGSATGPRPPGRASGDAARPWDIRAPVSTREEALSALAGGASSILVAAAEPTEEVLADLLEGVLVDVAPIALDATGDGLDAAVALSRAVKSSPAAALAFHLDPIGQGGGEADLQRHAAGAATLATTHPRATLFLANGARIHDAGGEPAWELAFAVSCGVAYARALAEAGLETADAFGRVVLGFAIDNRPLINVAKLRAARLMWARVTGACGASVPGDHRGAVLLPHADPGRPVVQPRAPHPGGLRGGGGRSGRHRALSARPRQRLGRPARTAPRPQRVADPDGGGPPRRRRGSRRRRLGLRGADARSREDGVDATSTPSRRRAAPPRPWPPA